MNDASTPFSHDLVVVGGCGHVGLPLSIALASRGKSVVAYDINATTVKTVNDGTMPFLEPGAEPVLHEVQQAGRFRASTEPEDISGAETVIVVIGTPIDEYLSPDPQAIPRALRGIAEHFVPGQLLVLRSTVYPGVTQLVERTVAEIGRDLDVAFCPERIAEGRAMTELFDLPQLVAARTDRARQRAQELFRCLTSSIVELEPEEAELAKLFTNTWRYIKFATANQFYMIANDSGLDFERIRQALSFEYPRAADLPGAGFAAGPCLFKDAMQLAAYNNNNFPLGHAAMLVNEGLPLYLVSRMEAAYDLPSLTVGILGMAFKADSDDIRSSLSYKLRRLLGVRAREVLCTDPYVQGDGRLTTLDEVLERSDLLVVGAPHSDYRSIEPRVPVVDIWNLFAGGVRV